MIETEFLAWLQTFSSWYIALPLIIIIIRWKTHDVFRRRVAFYVIFNISFTLITTVVSHNIFMFYLASPIFLWIIYTIFSTVLSEYKVWNFIKWLVIGFSIFAIIDMFWIEDYKNKFPDYIYPPQEIIVLFMVYYYLYIFSKEARQDFSSLWISLGIGFSAMVILIILLYNPYLGFRSNTLGDFIWSGLGSLATIISYSFVSYGLYIAQPSLINQ